MTEPRRDISPEEWAVAYRKLSDEVRAIRNSIRLRLASTYLSGIATGLALAFLLWIIAGVTR